jgi:DNA-binding MarR family transcriptional regulator
MSSDLLQSIRQARPFDSLRQEALLNLWRTASAMQDGLERVLKQQGVSAAQYNVLRILRGAGAAGLCRNEIRDRLVARMPDVTRLLDRLQALGLVRRERGTADRRQVSTYLTEAGAALLASLDAPVSAEHDRQLGHMSDEQVRALIELTTTARQVG